MLVYCPDFTKQSRLAPAYLTDLNAICYGDYNEPLLGKSILCIDLDKYETSCVGDNDATMDAAAGIADYRNNRVSFPRHLLIELRLGYESLGHLNISRMKQKVIHSKDILSPEPINERVVFIFNSHVAPLARSIISRLSHNDSDVRKWDVMCVEDFSEYIKEESEIPYIPVNNLTSLRSSLELSLSKGGLNDVDSLLNYWKNQIEKYKLHYQLEECKLIANVIIEFLNSIIVDQDSFEKEIVNYWIDIFSNV